MTQTEQRRWGGLGQGGAEEARASLWKQEKRKNELDIYFFPPPFVRRAEGTFQREDFYYNAVKIAAAYSAVP